MRIDYKVTTWVRCEFIDQDKIDLNDLISKLKEIDNPIYALSDYNIKYKTLSSQYEEYLPSYENGGQATVELYDGNDNIIWDNAITEDEIL